MQTINKQTLTLDLVLNTLSPLPRFTQYDNNVLDFIIKSNGADADLTDVDRITVDLKRPDGIVISRTLLAEDNVVTYEFGQEEQQIVGNSELIIRFFNAENERLSTKKVEVKFTESFEPTLEQPEQLQLLETLFAEVDTALLNMSNAEAIRISNESTRQAQETTRQTNTTTAINDLNAVKNANVNVYKSPVANFGAIATTYPTPSLGWKVQTTDNGKFYRYDGSTWVFVEEMNNAILTDIQIQVNETNRQSTTLSHGVSIVNAPVDGPVDFNVEGRTLTSLGNSNLTGEKYHALTGKNYKVKVDNITYTGVTKFQKKSTLTSKADLNGKVQASTVENPNNSRWAKQATLQNPTTGTWGDFSTADFVKLSTLNAVLLPTATADNGYIGQELFSFDLIAHIERNMGRIPKTTVADKVQWIKDNVNSLTANWHGFGSSVGGNKATFRLWNSVASSWLYYSSSSHLSSAVAKLTLAPASIVDAIDTSGFVHYIAVADASDGSVASSISTDFVDLQVDLKSTAVLDTRPIVIRVEDFANKISGSTVENPHKYGNVASATLPNPSSFVEGSQLGYDRIKTLDGTVITHSTTTNGQYSTHPFSFDIIQSIERNVGRIPKATLAEKVQWVKDNVAKITADWHGFGSSVGGNKATFLRWNVTGNAWAGVSNTTSSSVAKVSQTFDANGGATARMIDGVDANGMVHFLAHADASDGVVSSTINTDMISCEIELKPEAILHDPSVPLYEVDGTTEYPNILVTWDENTVLSRYPRVQGSKPLDGLAVIAEGENLLPPFSEWTLHANAVVKSPYELELNATSADQKTTYNVSVLPNQTYKFSFTGSGRVQFGYINASGTFVNLQSYGVAGEYTINTTSDTRQLSFIFLSLGAGKFTFTNPMLNVGSTAKPFVPRNPSYLFAPVKLGQIGDKKDSLFRQDGVTYLRKEIERVDLDGSLAWSFNVDKIGYKTFITSSAIASKANGYTSQQYQVVKYNGSLLTSSGSDLNIDNVIIYDNSHGSAGKVVITISDIDTGLGETYSATSDECKAIMWGWQAKTVDANGKPTAWRSLGDGTDAPTQTLAYVKDNKAPNFTPYKLSYVRATASQENVSHLVEGDLVVGGATQVEVTSGVIVREKVTPTNVVNPAFYDINVKSQTATHLKNKSEKLFAISKNGNIDKNWTIVIDAFGNGKQRAVIAQSLYDTTAEYTVTYLVLDRHLFTVNALAVKATYPGNIRGALDDVVVRQSDLASRMSVHDLYLYKLLLGAKNAGWNI